MSEQEIDRLLWSNSLKGWVKDHIPDWDKEQPIIDWLKGIGSEKTKANIKNSFPLFLGFIKESPQQIYDKRVEHMMSKDPKIRSYYERKIIEFKNVLEENNYDKNTIRPTIGRIQSFFKHNYIGLSFPRGTLKVTVSNYVKSKRRTKTPPYNEDIRKMYQIADLDDKLLIMFMYQYGNAPIDVSMLRIETIHIKEDTKEDEFIYWEYNREKTDVPVRTALNPEIIIDYKSLMKRKGYPDKGWVFTTNRGNRLREDHINDRIKAIALKADIENVNEFKVKDLRDSFNEACLESKINPELKDCLFGHKRSGAKEHYSVSQKAIIEAYKTVFQIVSVNHRTYESKGYEQIEQLFTSIVTALLDPDPKKSLISVIEKMGNVKEGTIEKMLLSTGRITEEQIKNMIFRK
jgi:site-specific recombinase XerD